MRRPVPLLILLVSLPMLFCCPSRSGGGDPNLAPTEDTLVDGLRFELSASAWPAFLLHWRATLRGRPPSSFRIFLSTAPLGGADRAKHQIAEVGGNERSFAVSIPRGDGLRYLAVQAIESDRSPGHVSKTFAIDTTDRIAFQVLEGTKMRIWMTDAGGKAFLVAPHSENFNWTPGSRALSVVSATDNHASLITPAIWNGKTDPNAAPSPSLPDGRIPADWFSMRVSINGLVAYRAGPTGKRALFVRKTNGEVTRVSAEDGDVEQFAWSPTGLHLLFLQQQGSALNRNVHVVAADGSNLRMFNDPFGADEYVLLAHWSGDGSAVAFHVVDAKTSSVGEVTVRPLSDHQLRTTFTAAHESRWGGGGLVFTTRHANGMGISVFRSTPGPFGPISPLVVWEGSIFGLRISSDGRWLAFVHRDTARDQHAYVFDLHNNRVQKLAIPAATTPLRYAWSGDGRFLAVLLQGATRASLVVFDSATSFSVGTEWLSGLRIGHFEWSPFAEEIAAIRADPISRLVRTDGARVVEVSAGVPRRLFVTDFVWSNWGRARSFGVFSTFVSK